jgi:hypothetical protein
MISGADVKINSSIDGWTSHNMTEIGNTGYYYYDGYPDNILGSHSTTIYFSKRGYSIPGDIDFNLVYVNANTSFPISSVNTSIGDYSSGYNFTYGDHINVTVYYYDINRSSPILNAETYIKAQLTGDSKIRNYTFVSLGEGYYYFNTSGEYLNATSYNLFINITMLGYQPQTNSCNIYIKGAPTALEIQYNGTGISSNEFIYKESVNITVRYYRTIPEQNLASADLYVYGEWDGYSTSHQLSPLIDGYYSFTYNYYLPVGIWGINVTASKIGYDSKSDTSTYLNITKATATLISNTTYVKLHWTEEFSIQLTYNDTTWNDPILNAATLINANWTMPGPAGFGLVQQGGGNYTFKVPLNNTNNLITNPGIWFLNFWIDHQNYTYNSIDIEVEIIAHTDIFTYDRQDQIANYEFTYENETLIIWLQYIDIDFNENLTDVTEQIATNWTNGFNATLDPNNNLYKIEFNTSLVDIGDYTLNISISKLYYDSAWILINTTIFSKNETALYFVVSPPSSVNSGNKFSIVIQLNQTDTDPETPLKGAVIKLYINNIYQEEQITNGTGMVVFDNIIALSDKYYLYII